MGSTMAREQKAQVHQAEAQKEPLNAARRRLIAKQANQGQKVLLFHSGVEDPGKPIV